VDKPVDEPTALPAAERRPDESTPRERAVSVAYWSLVLLVIVGLGPIFGFLRTIVAVAMFSALAYFGIRQVRSMMTNIPDPEPTDVSEYGLKYVCEMCGLELKVEVAAKERAPTHCMEPMKLVRTGGKPPLRPLD
jgi:hypothetical protein